MNERCPSGLRKLSFRKPPHLSFSSFNTHQKAVAVQSCSQHELGHAGLYPFLTLHWETGMRLMPFRTECCLMGRAAFFLKPCLFFVISVGSAAVLHRVASPLLSVSLSLLRPTSVFMLTEFPTASVKWLSFTFCVALTPVLLRLLAGVGLTRSREAPVGWGGKFCLLCLVVSHQVVGVLLVMKVLAPFHQNYFT